MSKLNSIYPMILNEDGEDRLLRVAQATACLSELLSASCYGGNQSVPGDGVASLFSLLSEQIEEVISQNHRYQEEHYDRF